MSTKSKDRAPKLFYDQTSDIVFVVEDKKIYFTKAFLIACSPVFERMFEGEFAEKDAREIPLPDKKYGDIVEFFKHIHPAYATLSTVTDANLLALLDLSREYQMDEVRKRCRLYIWKESGITGDMFFTWSHCDTNLGTDRLVLFLYACEQHDFQDMLPVLKDMASRKNTKELGRSEYWELLQDKTLLDIYRSRCEYLDK